MKEFLISIEQAQSAIISGIPILQLYTKDYSSVYFMKACDIEGTEKFYNLRGFFIFSTQNNRYIETLIWRGAFTLEGYTKKIHPETVLKDSADEAFEAALAWKYEYIIPFGDEEQEQSKEVRTVKQTKKEKRTYNVQFFPVGTFLTRSWVVHFAESNWIPPEVYRVDGIQRNGINSHIIRTDVPSKIDWIPNEVETFNIQWTEKIIERGSVFKIDFSENTRPKDIRNALECAALLGDDLERNAKKGELVYYDLGTIIRSLVRELNISEHAILDIDLLSELLKKQSFVKEIVLGSLYGFNTYRVNKKRAKRFIRQNQNRCLVSGKKAQEKHDRAMYQESLAYDDWYDELPEIKEDTGPQKNSDHLGSSDSTSGPSQLD